MLFAEDPARWAGWKIDILGTDVSEGMVERAREGSYTQFEVQRGLGIQQMIRWFEEGPPAGARSRPCARRPLPGPQLLEPAPHPGKFDLILCRNVLLYLNENTRRKAFERLSSALAPDGWLMLGAGETVIGQAPRWKPTATCAASTGTANRR
jgi:chemotaxis protein methyltransferase CheR